MNEQPKLTKLSNASKMNAQMIYLASNYDNRGLEIGVFGKWFFRQKVEDITWLAGSFPKQYQKVDVAKALKKYDFWIFKDSLDFYDGALHKLIDYLVTITKSFKFRSITNKHMSQVYNKVYNIRHTFKGYSSTAVSLNYSIEEDTFKHITKMYSAEPSKVCSSTCKLGEEPVLLNSFVECCWKCVCLLYTSPSPRDS